jgi:hypothetical protein
VRIISKIIDEAIHINESPEKRQAFLDELHRAKTTMTALTKLTASAIIFGTIVSRKFPLTGSALSVLGFGGTIISNDCFLCLKNAETAFERLAHSRDSLQSKIAYKIEIEPLTNKMGRDLADQLVKDTWVLDSDFFKGPLKETLLEKLNK